MTAPLPAEAKPEIDAIVETIIYLYTESRRLTKGMASQFGLTGPQLTVIKLLESFGDLSLSSLSERIRAQNSTVTGIIDRMEREGLVRRERSTSDRRVIYIRLSEKGEKLARQIEVEPMEIFRSALLGLSHADLRDLLRILTKLQRKVRGLITAAGQGGAAATAPATGSGSGSGSGSGGGIGGGGSGSGNATSTGDANTITSTISKRAKGSDEL